jgi:hypothetical protein
MSNNSPPIRLLPATPDNSSEYEPSSLPGFTPSHLFPTESTIGVWKPLPSSSTPCKRLKITIKLDSSVYIAGQNLHGRLVVECKGGVKLGEIDVLFEAGETVNHRVVGGEVSKRFLSAGVQYQGPRSPRSNGLVRFNSSRDWSFRF